MRLRAPGLIVALLVTVPGELLAAWARIPIAVAPSTPSTGRSFWPAAVTIAKVEGKDSFIGVDEDQLLSWNGAVWETESLPFSRHPAREIRVQAVPDGSEDGLLFVGARWSPELFRIARRDGKWVVESVAVPGLGTYHLAYGRSRVDGKPSLYVGRALRGEQGTCSQNHVDFTPILDFHVFLYSKSLIPVHERLFECNLGSLNESCVERMPFCARSLIVNPYEPKRRSDVLIAGEKVFERSDGSPWIQVADFPGRGHAVASQTQERTIYELAGGRIKLSPDLTVVQREGLDELHVGFESVVAASLHRDGLERVYRAAGDGRVFEFTRSSSGWERSEIGGDHELRRLVVGDLRGDGRQHLYAFEQASPLFENDTRLGAPEPVLWEITHFERRAIIAVGTFVLADSAQQRQSAILRGVLADELKHLGHFTLVEDEQADQILASRAREETLCQREACLAGFGELVKAEWVLAGRVERIEAGMRVVVRVFRAGSPGPSFEYARLVQGKGELLAAVRALAREVGRDWPDSETPR